MEPSQNPNNHAETCMEQNQRTYLKIIGTKLWNTNWFYLYCLKRSRCGRYVMLSKNTLIQHDISSFQFPISFCGA